MGQLSFYSADAHPRALTDLEGVLCARGQLSVFGRGATARLSIVLGDPPPPWEEDGDGGDDADGDPAATASADAASADAVPARAAPTDAAPAGAAAAPLRRAGRVAVASARAAPPLLASDPEELAFLDLEPEDLARLAARADPVHDDHGALTADADPAHAHAHPADADPAAADAHPADADAHPADDIAEVLGGLSAPDGLEGPAGRAGALPAAADPAALPDPVAEWRAHALRCAFAARGIDADLDRAADGRPVVRSAYRADLVALARRWRRGAVKALPPCFELDGPRLRLWVLAAGRFRGRAYLLGLDPHAVHTHEPLLTASRRAGLAATLGGDRTEPVLRVVGRRPQRRLAELVGDPPRSLVDGVWPG